MKIRKFFVSNSSTSSYICDICGNIESGMDLCLSEAQMVQSKWGTYCEDHLDKSVGEMEDELNEKINNLQDENEDKNADQIDELEGQLEELRYNISDEYCPLYNLKYIEDSNLLKYLLKDLGRSKKQIIEEIRKRFGNLKNLTDFCKDISLENDE